MMEVDSPQAATTAAAAATTQIKIHPLAIIGISDHQTRVTTGGSPLSSSSTMIGLLFGYHNGVTISIIDSEEVEYPSSSSANGGVSTITPEQQQIIKTKIELHQKVFPMHEVVGWYRIDTSTTSSNNNNNNDDEDVLPTEADLMINNGWMKEYNQSPLFVLMDANEKTISSSSAEKGTGTNSNGDEKDPKKKKNDMNTNTNNSSTIKTYNSKEGEDAREKLDRDEQLPLSIYETMNNGSGGVFVNLDFELETFEPERIAVEKVFQTQPKTSGTSSSRSTAAAAAAASASTTKKSSGSSKPSTNPEDGNDTTTTAANTTTQVQFESPAAAEIQSLITSIDAMNTRIAVLLDFLHKTKSGEIPPNHALLRQVGSLINQLPLVLGKGVFSDSDSGGSANLEEGKMENVILANEFEDEYDDMLIVSFLAAIAKTTKSVLSYSARFRVMNTSGRKDSGKGRYERSYKDDI